MRGWILMVTKFGSSKSLWLVFVEVFEWQGVPRELKKYHSLINLISFYAYYLSASFCDILYLLLVNLGVCQLFTFIIVKNT